MEQDYTLSMVQARSFPKTTPGGSLTKGKIAEVYRPQRCRLSRKGPEARESEPASDDEADADSKLRPCSGSNY